MTKHKYLLYRQLAVLLILMLIPAVLDTAAAQSDNGQQSLELENELQAPQARRWRSRRVEGYYKGRITAHWLGDKPLFWYRNDLSGNTKEFTLVDAQNGLRKQAFDHAKLATALARATDQTVEPTRLPFDRIEFSDDMRTVRFAVDQSTWSCDLETYVCAKSDTDLSPAPDARGSEASRFGRESGGRRRGGNSVTSSDGKWVAFVRDHNVFVRTQEQEEDQAVQLSTDGHEGRAYGQLSWAPELPVLVAYRVEPGANREVYLIETAPEGGGRARLHTLSYALPGDKFATYELNLFDVEQRKQIKPEVEPLKLDWQRPRLHWRGSRFAYEKIDRGHQRFRVIEVDARTGQARHLIDEKTDTFIWTAHTENLRLQYVNWLDQTDEIIYASERDGWRHLYLIDAQEGRVKQQITQGPWVLRGIDRIDPETRQIWFHASGKNPDQDPYFVHYYRVNFDGTDLVALTEGNGTHSVQYSPERRYLIDTYSRVDQAPIHALRRSSDGSLVCELERADISELMVKGWKAPEVFVAKGRDKATDIWGLIYRPGNFDPQKKYPVIEYIYAGPQSAYVPKRFSPSSRYASLTDLGFIVVQMDAMGTAHRSKAFHDVCWKNLKDAGFPDRILWHRAVARKYPYYDLSRVGIYGNSAGGQNAAGALLFHPEFYHVAVASCGCHDNRMDKASWNEQWMGYPLGPQYSECSNIDNAQRLRGRLLLIVGGMDNNVPPESTLRLADALIQADRDFDLLVLPKGRHGMGGAYGARRMQDFFVRHLQGIEPPNHNAQETEIQSIGTRP